MKNVFLIFWVLLIFSFSAKSQKVEVLHFLVETGAYDRTDTPVNVDIEGVSKSDTLDFRLYEKVNGKMIEKPCQVELCYTTQLWLILDGTTRSGKEREFYLYAGVKNKLNNSIYADVISDGIMLKKDDSKILHYQASALYPPEKVDTIYKRSGFIHPLYTPAGNVLTRVNPPDHYHHVGLWNPWTKVKIGDHVTDFWNLYEKQGTVQFAGVNSIVNGPVYGGFSVRQEHIDFQGKYPEKPAINEVWDVRAWNAEPVPGIKAFLVDITTFLSVPGDSSITFEAYRYGGGIGIRMNEEWTNKNSTVLTSEGKTRLDADGTRARWTDLNVTLMNNNQSGITFFSHPANREHPEPMRVWPSDANNERGDLFFEFCPIRLKDWILYPGNVYRLKYRMLIYDGQIDKQTAWRVWNDFAYPPVVKVLKK